MATDIGTIRNRIASVVAAAPFEFLQAQSPFDFDAQPTGEIDAVYRLETSSGRVIGGFNFTEDRTDLVTIWLARKLAAAPESTYQQLVTDASSMRAAVIREGTSWGEYGVPDDGFGGSVDHQRGAEYAVLRLTLPINFEALL